MKKYTVLLLCMACSIPLFSQIDRLVSSSEPSPIQYKPYLDGVARWSTLYDAIDRGIVSENIIAYGDTVINNISYKKMWTDNTNFNETEWKNHSPIFDSYYFLQCLFIRESEDASKLYFYNSCEDVEFIISDMNLQKGDSIALSGWWNNPINYVVDSVYFKDELKHIVIDYDVVLLSKSGNLIFVEGMGPNSGILTYNPNFLEINGAFFNNDGALNCFQNQTLFHKMNIDFDFPCGYSTPVNVENISDEKFNIFVESDNIHITLATDEKSEISIYDVSGTLLFCKKYTERNIMIPTSSFYKGVYIVKVNYPNKPQILTTKIIL